MGDIAPLTMVSIRPRNMLTTPKKPSLVESHTQIVC